MAYGKIKTWIAAEVLTASDLNDEFSNSVTNENDLGTKLTAEITTRTTLESEYDTFYAASWNSGDSQIKDNVVALGSMKDNSVDTNELVDLCITNDKLDSLCITHGKVAAANKDGTVSTPSMRTIGTGALQAMAGNTSMAQNLESIENGSIMLPFFDLDNGTAYDTTNDAWTLVTGNFRVYIPVSATLIHMAGRVKKTANGIAASKFMVDTLSSNTNSCVSDTFVWETDCTLNVSSLSGWYNIGIYLKRTSVACSHLQGFSFVWE